MPTVPFRLNPPSSPSRASASKPHLTAEEWCLILEALSAYKHHADYRNLYEKLACRAA